LVAETLRLHSGRTADLEMRLSTFTHTWARSGYWALVVLPPDRLPATAGEQAVLEAASALERANRPDDAASAFAAILTKWPEGLPAWIGLGNASYAAGDKPRAAAAFATATEHHPESLAAWQNLAFVLAELGETAAATDAAARAATLSGAKNQE
jgi:predicted Zn-dependent protease